MGTVDHSERESERGKKSISLINLARLATLARLIWINEMGCGFSSACCPQFTRFSLMKLTPVWLLCQIFIGWSSMPGVMAITGISGTPATNKCMFLFRWLWRELCCCLSPIWSCATASAEGLPVSLTSTGVAERCSELCLCELQSAPSNTRLSQCAAAWPPSLLLLNLRRISVCRQ